jgi:hypothetical protein
VFGLFPVFGLFELVAGAGAGGPEVAGGGPEVAGGGPEAAGGGPEVAGGGPEVAGASAGAGSLLGPVIASRAAYPATVDAVPMPKSIATFFKSGPQATLLLRAGPR